MVKILQDPPPSRDDPPKRPDPVGLGGAALYPGYVTAGEQGRIVADIRTVVAAAPLFSPMTPSGRPMTVRMTSAGRYGWLSDRRGYRYGATHPSGTAWPAIPASVLKVWRDLVGPDREPDCCLVNFYAGAARMGLHQDRDEADYSWPVLSISLGDDARFRIGGTTRGGKTTAVWLRSGDVLVLGGAARLAYHGIDRIAPGTSMLLPRGGRINLALPIDDRSASEILLIERPAGEPARDRYVYYPGTAPVPEGVAVNVRNRSYKILANVEITEADAGGVIFAHGSRFGGHALFIEDRKLHYVYNFLGIKPEQKFVSSEVLKPGKYTLGMEFTRTGAGPHKESLGTTKLYINDKVVAEGPMKTQPAKFTLSGDGLCIGYDSGDAVSGEYKTPGTFRGGTIQAVGVTIEKASYEALEMEAQRAMIRD
jgi:DNA alkylation damage repair protein AlkB